MLKWENLWTLFRLSYIPILPVIARISAILYGANVHNARDSTKSREFKKREFREFWVKGSQILFWQIKRVLFIKKNKTLQN